MRVGRKIVAKLLLAVVLVAVLGRVVMGLWNWVVPELVSGAHAIDYPHAIGLLVLSRILFGGFRGHGGCRGRKHWHHWQGMTRDEREQLRGGATSAARRDGEANV